MLLGCDTSHFQSMPDFAAMKAGGVGFIIDKATQGTGFRDPSFAARRTGARGAGLIDGAYHFADGEDPAAESKYFCDVVGPLSGGELVALDYEIHLADPVSWCLAWLRATRARLGVHPLIYLNQSTMAGFNWDPVVAEGYPLWLARYDAVTTAPSVVHWSAAAIKQYSDKGTVAGIPGALDVDVFYGDLAALQRYGYGSGAVSTSPATTPVMVPHAPPAPAGFDVRNWRAQLGARGAVFEHLQLFLNHTYPAYSHIAPLAAAYGPQTARVLAEMCRRLGIGGDGKTLGPRTAAALYAAGFRG